MKVVELEVVLVVKGVVRELERLVLEVQLVEEGLASPRHAYSFRSVRPV